MFIFRLRRTHGADQHVDVHFWQINTLTNMLLNEMQIFSICHTDHVFAQQVSLYVYSCHPHATFYETHLNSRHREGFNSK